VIARRAVDGTFESRVASELEASLAHLSDARAAGVPVDDAKRAMRRSRGRTDLTAAQRREVRRMVEDGEAYTRAEAVAWVLEMGGE